MTSLTGDDEHVIASHSFADAAAVVPIAEQHPTRTENDAAPGTSCATSGECPDGQHRWMVVREYHGRDYFFVTELDEQPDGVRVTADSSVDSDEIVEVHSERLACRDCPAERGDVTMADYR